MIIPFLVLIPKDLNSKGYYNIIIRWNGSTRESRGEKMQLIREINDNVRIKNASDVYENYLQEMGNEDKELFIVLGLDTKNKVIYREIVGVGTLDSCYMGSRETFKKAIQMSCNSIVVAHNHPSQETEPSQEDVDVTKQLVKSGDILGITVLDHVVFSNDGYYSMRDKEDI